MKKQRPIGELFSRLYIEPGPVLADSKRFRERVAGYFAQHLASDFSAMLLQIVRTELGCRFNNAQTFFLEAEIADVLSGITLLHRLLTNSAFFDDEAQPLREFIERTFREENSGYTIDKRGGVHYAVDEEFSRNRTSSLRCLETASYAAARDHVLNAFEALDAMPPNTRRSVREIFEGVESLVKVITGSNKDLSDKMIKEELRPRVQRIHCKIDSYAEASSLHLLEGLCEWIDAGHKYRHGAKSEAIVAPPLDLAVLHVSTGAGYIRWLVGLSADKSWK